MPTQPLRAGISSTLTPQLSYLTQNVAPAPVQPPIVALQDATSGPVTFTMPSATVLNQEVIVFKTDSSANGVTVQPLGGDLLNGVNSAMTPITIQGDKIRLICDVVGSWRSA